jgi:hypothetical protein
VTSRTGSPTNATLPKPPAGDGRPHSLSQPLCSVGHDPPKSGTKSRKRRQEEPDRGIDPKTAGPVQTVSSSLPSPRWAGTDPSVHPQTRRRALAHREGTGQGPGRLGGPGARTDGVQPMGRQGRGDPSQSPAVFAGTRSEPAEQSHPPGVRR